MSTRGKDSLVMLGNMVMFATMAYTVILILRTTPAAAPSLPTPKKK